MWIAANNGCVKYKHFLFLHFSLVCKNYILHIFAILLFAPNTCSTITCTQHSLYPTRALNALAEAGAKLNVPNRLGICPVDAAKGDALTWLEERGFHPDEAMVHLLAQHEAMEKETMQSGKLP